MGRDLVGSALKTIACNKYWFPGRNINARLKQVVAAVKLFAKQNEKQVSLKKLSKSSLGWTECPEFTGSAADTAVYLAGKAAATTLCWLDRCRVGCQSHLRIPLLSVAAS